MPSGTPSVAPVSAANASSAGHRVQPEPRGRGDAPGAGANARIARMAAHVELGDHADETKSDEHERQQR